MEIKKVIKTDIVCGELITTQYFENDTLVREDQTINVSEEYLKQAMLQSEGRI